MCVDGRAWDTRDSGPNPAMDQDNIVIITPEKGTSMEIDARPGRSMRVGRDQHVVYGHEDQCTAWEFDAGP